MRLTLCGRLVAAYDIEMHKSHKLREAAICATCEARRADQTVEHVFTIHGRRRHLATPQEI